MNYGKKGVRAKQKALNAKASKWGRKLILTLLKVVLIAVIGVGICGVAGGIGAFKGILANTPTIRLSDVVASGQATIVYDREGNEIQLFDIIETPEEDAHTRLALKEDIKRLYQLVESELSPRERLVLKMRYGLYEKEEYTQKEVAKHLGISRSYVSRIEKSAIEKLRAHFH